MQKLVIVIILSFFSSFLYGQFPESFEGGTFPPPDWIYFDNGTGTAQFWRATDVSFFGERAAFIRWEDVDTLLAEDWLVSPKTMISADAPFLTFYQRQGYAREYYSEYTIRISTSANDNPADFT